MNHRSIQFTVCTSISNTPSRCLPLWINNWTKASYYFLFLCKERSTRTIFSWRLQIVIILETFSKYGHVNYAYFIKIKITHSFKLVSAIKKIIKSENSSSSLYDIQNYQKTKIPYLPPIFTFYPFSINFVWFLLSDISQSTIDFFKIPLLKFTINSL